MGCNCSRDTKIVFNKNNTAKNQFVLKVNIPKTNKTKLINHNSGNDKEAIVDLFNSFFFSANPGNELDANFISVYNNQTNTFDYFIQRLAGFEMENDGRGKMWNFYLNKEKTNWSMLCNNNRILNAKDDMELKYESESTGNHSTNCVTTQSR